MVNSLYNKVNRKPLVKQKSAPIPPTAKAVGFLGEEIMKKKEGQPGFLTTLLNAVIAIINFLTGLTKSNEEKRKQEMINNAKNELKKALAEGRIGDAAYWRKMLSDLGAIASLAVLLLCQGCITPKPEPAQPTFFLLGERINKVEPGQLLEVPKLTPPAKQWYMVDDVGLYQWLGIKP